jgi:undecaprenyl pyrophosphate phosphatase UppP
MTVVWILIGVIVVIVWVVTIVDILRHHLGTMQTVAWLLIVLILPLIGSLLYWALRRPSQEEVEREIANAEAMRHGGSRPPFDSTHVG